MTLNVMTYTVITFIRASLSFHEVNRLSPVYVKDNLNKKFQG